LKTFVLFEKYKSSIEDNPSSEWLINQFNRGEKIFVMRETRTHDEEVLNFSNFFKVLLNYSLLKTQFEKSSLIWLRMPSPLTFLTFVFFYKTIKKKECHIHFCANILTFSFLKRKFNFINLGRFLYGQLLKIIFKKSSKHYYYYTGTHVKKNLRLNLDSKFIIDQSTEEQVKMDGEGVAYFGRFLKLKDLKFLKFIEDNKITVHCYGSGDKVDHENLIFHGLLSSRMVQNCMNTYKTIILPGNEYFEGFPRIIYLAMKLNKNLIISNESNFIDDIRFYPNITFYGDRPFSEINEISELDIKTINKL